MGEVGSYQAAVEEMPASAPSATISGRRRAGSSMRSARCSELARFLWGSATEEGRFQRFCRHSAEPGVVGEYPGGRSVKSR